jgi:hypothetical protein
LLALPIHSRGTVAGTGGCQRLEAFMLTDAQIAILCDIGQASSFDENKKGEVVSLIIRGFIEKDGDIFKITPRGEKVLTDRGAGLNES